MNSKERVKTSINHKKPDRVPLGEVEIDAPIVEKVLGRPTFYGARLSLLKAYWEGRRDEVVDSMKRDYVEFIRKTGFDIVEIRLVPDKNAVFKPWSETSNNDFIDENGNEFKWSPDSLEIMLMHGGKGPITVAESTYAFNEVGIHFPTESELEFASYVIKELGETHYVIGPVNGGFGIPATSMGWPASMAAPYRDPSGMMNMLNALIDDPEWLRDQQISNAKGLADALAYWKKFGCDTIWTANDYGFNMGTFMSPKHFDEYFLPGLVEMARQVHSAGMPHIFHSCGNNRAIWKRFEEAGVDVYQSIQDEEPLADLKKLHGSKITFWGGVSSRLLEIGTPEKIKEQVKKAIEDAGEEGGFILGSTHSLGPGVKYENFMAMLEAWHQYR